MPIRDQGFGLNFNRGFGSGKFFATGGDPSGQRIAASGYQDRMRQEDQNRALDGRQQRQFGQDRDLLNLQLGQRERDSVREDALGRAGLQNQMGIAGIQARTQGEVARMQTEASMLPARLQQERFGQVFPYLRDALGGTAGDLQSGYRGQGQVGNQPTIDADNVLSEQQIQQQVNAGRASNDQRTGGAQRALAQRMAARGYGTNSPLAMELGVGLSNQNLAQNSTLERETRYDAAQGNAKQRLGAQTAREGQFASRQQEDIERNRVASGRYNALLGALAGLV